MEPIVPANQYKLVYYTIGYSVFHYTFTVHQDGAREATIHSGGIFRAHTTPVSACIYFPQALDIASPTF